METWDLIGKKLSGELTPDESLRFDAWLRSDASHEEIWNQAREIWASAGTIDASFEPDTEMALQKVKTTCINADKSRSKKFFTPLRIAASILLLVIPAFLIIKFIDNKEQVIAENEAQEGPPVFAEINLLTMTATDSAVSFFLPDSTHIYLNKNSSLTYPENFTTNVRGVKLSGEAFFEVIHNAQKPFIIEAGNTETTVTGTSFNIKEDKRSKKVVVTVVTGQVKFKAKKNSGHLSEVTLTPHDRASYSEANATLVKQKVKGSEDYWWTKNFKYIRKLFQDAKHELTKPRKKK